jgi:hypothetical protein
MSIMLALYSYSGEQMGDDPWGTDARLPGPNSRFSGSTFCTFSSFCHPTVIDHSAIEALELRLSGMYERDEPAEAASQVTRCG